MNSSLSRILDESSRVFFSRRRTLSLNGALGIPLRGRSLRLVVVVGVELFDRWAEDAVEF